MAKKYITDKLQAKTASSGITYEGDAVFNGGTAGTFSFDFNNGTTNTFSINFAGDDFLTVDGGTGVFEAGDIAGLADGFYLKVDPGNNLLSWKASQDDLVTFAENSTVSLYGTGTNNASGAEINILKGQSNEVTGKLKLSTGGYVELEYEDPGATNSFRLYQDYGYISNPLRIGANASANELDDYEEGDWTPTIAGYMGGMSGTSYTIQTGKYTKIGNLVRLNFRLYFYSTIGTVGQTLIIGGLPFTPDSTFDEGTLFSVGNKSRVDFVYNNGFGRVSLSVIGARKFIGSEFTITCDDGTSVDALTTDALTGSSSNQMVLEGGFLYKT